MAGMALADGLPEALPGIRLLLLPVLLAGMLTPTFSLIQNPFSMAGPDFFTQSSFQQECWQGNGWVEIRKTIRREFDTSRIVEVDFAGVHLFMGRSQLTQPKILPVTDPSPSLNMHFMLRGKGTAQGLTGTPGSQFGGGQHNLTYRPGFEGRYRLEPGLVEQVNVQFDEVFFARLVEENCPLLSPLAEKMARRQAGQLASHPLPLTPALSSVLHQLQQSVPASPMRRLFLEAKVLELFALQVEQWEMGQPKRPSCWKGYDLDKLYAVKALLEEYPLQAY